MTKYYLHGWYIWVISPGNTRFFTSIIEEVQKNDISLLLVLYAREASRWEAKARETEERFLRVSRDKNLSCTIASDDIETFKNQIQTSDIIFFHGGDTQKLQKKLEWIEALEKLLDGKIVAGSSAGALIFSEYYYENDNDRYHKGLGFFPLKMICHWNGQQSQMEHLCQLGDINSPILTIAEWEFIVRDK